MAKYILRRVLIMIPVILGVSFIIFGIMSLTPGDPAMMILGEGATEEALEAKRDELGLNDPFFTRYFDYVKNALKGDFGTSYRTNLSVSDEIRSRLPYTVQLALFSTIIAVLIGLPVGVISAVKQYSLVDTSMLGVSLLLTSMPGFFLGLLLILVFSVRLGWLPMMGMDSFDAYILPCIAASSSTTASLLRMTRSTMLEVIRQDYIRTARAKGAQERRVIYHHALRNALLPVVTIIGINFGTGLGGAIIIESLFSIPGLGQLMITAIRQKDTPIVMAAVMFAALLAGLVNLVVDVVYCFIDPRLKSAMVSKKKKVRA